MKKVITLFGIIAFAAIIGFSFAACDDGTSGDNNSGNNNNDNSGSKGDGDGGGGGDVKEGSTATIKLSGTITIKNYGEAVPYVEILAHTSDYGWKESIRIPSSDENAPWEITTTPLDTETEILFHVIGFSDETSTTQLLNVDVKNFVKDFTMVKIHNQDKSGIDIDLADLKVITLNGTITVTYNGNPVPYVKIMAWKMISGTPSDAGDYWVDTFLSHTTLQTVSNTPWLFSIEGFDNDTDIWFQVNGYADTAQFNSDIAAFEWYGPWTPGTYTMTPHKKITVKDQDVANIFLTLGNQTP